MTTAPSFFWGPMAAATFVLLATYFFIISERVNRSIVALCGACIVILSGLLTQAQAVAAVDFNTLGLLIGMMIIVSVARRCGLFEYLALRAAQFAQAKPGRVLILLQVTTAILSALLDNVTTVLLIAPVTLALARDMKTPVYPFLFAEIFASNIGGTATLIGDPPNILIGSLAGLDFNAFLIHLAPVALLILCAQLAMIHLVWGRRLRQASQHAAAILASDARARIQDPLLLKQSLGVIACVLVGFVFAHPLNLEPASIALSGAAAMMLMDNWSHRGEQASSRIHSTFSDVEWITIFFFVGLFIVVKAVETHGLLTLLANQLVAATSGDLTKTGVAVLWSSAILSAFVDNIPFVATMIPLLKALAPAYGGQDAIAPLWWCLSLGACLGGNGTLIGASANLTVAGIAERAGVPFRFSTFLFYAFPMMLVSVGIAHVYLRLRYF